MKSSAHNKVKNKKNPFVGKSAQELMTKGEEYLNSKRYKDAIIIFKQLIKEDKDSADWNKLLANAYLGRTRELAAKKMYKEALVVWENMASLCGEHKEPYLYVSLLVNLGRYDEAVGAYIRFKNRITGNAQINDLDATLASLSLLNKGDFIKSIPKDSALLTHRDLALEALNAFCLEDDRLAKDILAKIPFKSPYKGIRMFIKALNLLYSGKQDEAKKTVGKLGANNLLARFFEVFRLSTTSGKELTSILPNLGIQEKEIMASLIGITTDRINLASELMETSLLKNTRRAFKLLHSNADILGSDIVKKTCIKILINYPSKIVQYEQLFGKLNPFESARIRALSAERQKRTEQASEYWETCLNELNHADFTADEKKLAAALILRRLANELCNEEPKSDSSRANMVSIAGKALGFLEKSLDYDPHDKNTYLEIIQISHVVHGQKVSQKWIDTAANLLRNDVEIQLLAAKAAADKKSFKKAMKHAEQVIKMDPINTSARNLMVTLLLFQARKQVKAKKFHLARKEFEKAAELERDKKTLASINFKHGLMEALANNNSACELLIAEGRRLLADSPSIAAFILTIESRRMGMPPEVSRQYNDEFTACTATSVSPKETIAIISMAESYALLNERGVNAGELADQYMQKALKVVFSESELKIICEFLQKRERFKTLSKYARKGIKLFPKHPIFTYYHMFGKCMGQLLKLSEKDMYLLDKAEEMATSQGDTKTAKLIFDFICDFEMPTNMPNMPNMPNPRQIMDIIMGKEGEELEAALAEFEDPFEEFDETFNPKNKKPSKKRSANKKKEPKGNNQQGTLF